jgi:transcriptional regulator with XRE-family HTH domain
MVQFLVRLIAIRGNRAMTNEVGSAVGTRIRSLREQQKVSLRTLADRCGLSANAISLIERGENSPTASSLQRLAAALDVPITDFFEEQHEQTVVFVRPEYRLSSQVRGIQLESLGIGLRSQQLEPFLMTVEPGAGTIDEPITHPGEEFVHCLAGEVDYCVGDHIYRLDAGSSLLFEATQPHCFRNTTMTPAHLMVVFFAGEGAHHLGRQRHLEMQPPEPRRAE